MIGSIQTALQGMNRNQLSMSQHAQRIARYDDPEVSLPEEMVGMMVAQRGFEANIPVIKAADEMLGSLIDILA